MSATVISNQHRDMASKTKSGYEQEVRETLDRPIRTKLILTSTELDKIESVCKTLLERAKMTANVTAKGVSRLPTKTLKITTRKSPCGEGSKTYDTYEMRIHKRSINLIASTNDVKKIVTHSTVYGVNIELTCQNVTK